MSEHSHTHAPGEEHSHSHSHAPQAPQMPAPDPAIQQAMDQSFKPLPLAVTEDGNNVVCQAHKSEKCDICNVDFLITNRLARLLVSQPNLLCPPPSNVVTPKLSQVVTTTKEEGNVIIYLPFSLFVLTFNFLLSLDPFQSWSHRSSTHQIYYCRFYCCITPSLGGQSMDARRTLHRHLESISCIY